MATDNCDAQVVCSPPPGSVFLIGTNIVVCTATDPSGNRATCTFRVVVKLGAADLTVFVSVSAGLVLIGWESARRSRTISMRGLGFVLAAALITAASVMMDAKGARLSQNPVGYAATIAVLNAVAMAALQASRGHNVTRMLVREWPVTVYAAAISSVSYQLFIWSLQQAPVALVGAMRETSMLFALFIAFFVLRERFGGWRWVAVALMLVGMLLMRL